MSTPARGRLPATAVRFVITAIVPVLLTGCGDRSDGPGERSETVLGPEAVQVLGTSDQLSRILDIQPGPDGMIWVLNEGPPFFVAFDESGSVVASHGRRGDGPQEFRSPMGLASGWGAGDGPDGVWAYDRGNHTLVRIDGRRPAGTGAATNEALAIRFPTDEVAPGQIGRTPTLDGAVWLWGQEDGFLLVRAAEPPVLWFFDARFWDTELVKLTAAGDSWAVEPLPPVGGGDRRPRRPQ